MQSFKKFLLESNTNSYEDIKRLLDHCDVKVKYSTTSHGIVARSDVKIFPYTFEDAKLTSMPPGLVECYKNFEYVAHPSSTFKSKLTSCENFPNWVGGSFWIGDEKITNLQGCPEIVEGDDCFISGGFSSLEGITRYVQTGQMTIESPSLTSLKDIHKHISYIHDRLDFLAPIKSNILGILKIKGIRTLGLGVEMKNYPEFEQCNEVFGILRKHLAKDRNILECQEELMDNGFKEYAKL